MTHFHTCVTHINEKLPQTGKYGRGLIFESSALTKQYVVKGYVETVKYILLPMN